MATKNESAQPQLPPRPTFMPSISGTMYINEDESVAVEYILALEAENVSLKAKLKTAGICELAVDNPNLASYTKEWGGRAEKAEAERDKALEVIREYRLSSISHRLCSIDFGCCSTCIQADALLKVAGVQN